MPIQINVELNDHGRSISEEKLPEKRISSIHFIEKICSGKTEALGRPEMIDIRQRLPCSLFFQALNYAYAYHHAFGIRPEILMYLINSVVAETVKQHPEDYRKLFSNEPNKQTIQIEHNGLILGNPNSPWDEAIGLFENELKTRVPDSIINDMMPKLSTHTTETKTANLITFMDAASPFYDYRVMTLCGIPRIVLFGGVDDYEKISSAASVLAEKFSDHLQPYFKGLILVLEKIITEIKNIEKGNPPDVSFWAQIYKKDGGSGSDSYSGWINAFVGYTKKINRNGSTQIILRNDLGDIWNGTVESGSEPCHISSVPFIWDYFGKEIPMIFAGGIIGLENEENALTPQLSYAVLNAVADQK